MPLPSSLPWFLFIEPFFQSSHRFCKMHNMHPKYALSGPYALEFGEQPPGVLMVQEPGED